jgi:haloacetate dehalogenase
VLWRKVSPALMRDHFGAMTDWRGYGDSSMPSGGADHSAYARVGSSGRDAASDLRSSHWPAMTAAGARRTCLARDHSKALTKLVILDIVPTHFLYQRGHEAARNVL